MSDDFIGIIGFCILGLIAHGAVNQRWLEWVLRVTYGLFFFGAAIGLMTMNATGLDSPWIYWVTLATTAASGLLLFHPMRRLFSLIFTVINQIVAGRWLLAACGKLQVPVRVSAAEQKTEETAPEAAQTPDSAEPASGAGLKDVAGAGQAATMVLQKASILQSLVAERVFVPESIPHMNGLWIYVTCIAILLTHTEPAGFKMPAMMIPIPVTFDQLFSYNFLGLIFLSFCGVGIFVSRKPLEALRRLGLVKPTPAQILLGVIGIFVTFGYDWLWSTFTHGQEGLGYAGKLTRYNEGTFTPGAAPGSAFFVASATGLCAGLGEETLIRGALQPVFGIVPAAFMHGALHGQFSHAPLLIVQVFIWSAMMGILRRYTNTTTTIITHVGFNFLSTFLIAFNP